MYFCCHLIPTQSWSMCREQEYTTTELQMALETSNRWDLMDFKVHVSTTREKEFLCFKGVICTIQTEYEGNGKTVEVNVCSSYL